MKDDKEGIWHKEVDAMLQAVVWTIYSKVSAAIRHVPANVLFIKGMALNQKVKVNWEAIKE